MISTQAADAEAHTVPAAAAAAHKAFASARPLNQTHAHPRVTQALAYANKQTHRRGGRGWGLRGCDGERRPAARARARPQALSWAGGGA